MKSHIEIGGTTPADEECANVGDEGYAFRARREARVFINQIKRQFKDKIQRLIVDGRLEIVLHSNPHDFGSYYDVVAKFEENDEVATNFAYQIENDVWTEWDDISRAELGLPILKSDADKHKEVQSNISKYKEFVESFYNYTLFAEDEDGSIDFLSSDASGWKKNPTHFSIELLAFGDYTGDMGHKANIKDMTELYEKLGLEPVTYDEAYSTETFLIKLTDLDNAEIKETLEGLKDYSLISDDTHSELENEGKTELLQEFWNDHSEELTHMGYTEQSFLSDEELNDDIIFETGAVPFSKKLNELEDEVRSIDTDEPYKPKKKKNPTKKSNNDNESHLDEFIEFIEKNKKTYFSGTIMDIKETRRGHKEVWVELDKPIKVLASKINQGKFVVGELKVSKIPKDNGFDIDVGDRVEVRLYMSLGGVLIETIKLNKKKK